MKDRKLAVRYARALLGATPDRQQASNIESFLSGISDAMAASEDLRESLIDPSVPRLARRDILVSVAKRYAMPPTVENFLATVVEHGRVAELPAIAELYRELREKQAGIVPATVTTAVPLTEDLRSLARATLERLTGKTVRLEFEVDSAVLGGAVTRMGSEVYDGSLRTQLGMLRRKMAEE